MKNKSIICALLLACGVGMSTTSCEDMLSADSDRTIHTNANDTLYGYWGIMKAVQNIAERYVILGEARADLVYPTSSVSDTISNIANFNPTKDGDCRFLEVKDYYTVINGCNNYLANVDSLKLNSNGVKVMQKEVAQVLAVRAWTYLQLVNNYGEVPYFTEPITSLGFVDDFDFSKAENKLNRENLIEKLIPALLPYKETELPNYGNYNNGATDIASQLTMFPIKVVMGDIYLTGAKSYEEGEAIDSINSDYAKAAQYYYEYLKDNGGYLSYTLNCTTYGSNGGIVDYQGNSWIGMFSEKTSNAETVTVVPSAAGKLYGNVLTGISNVFGWGTTSRMDTDSEEGSESEATTSASVSVYLDYKMRQLGPSQQYLSLCAAQDYVRNDGDVEKDAGDARQAAILPISGVNYITKSCPSGSFSYTYPVIYRKALIWLRFAEAINRAGFPSYAFAILKDGLASEHFPEYELERVDTLEDGTLDSVYVYSTFGKVCSYIPEAEFRKANYPVQVPYLKFTSEFSSMNGQVSNLKGVHARGCNNIGVNDTIHYTYKNMLFKKCVESGIDTLGIFADDILFFRIEAIEYLIVDELALETAWEGNRYPDLLRISSHKGSRGMKWFADKIARRGDPRDPESDYTQSAEYIDLYDKLVNDKSKWYLTLPAYK